MDKATASRNTDDTLQALWIFTNFPISVGFGAQATKTLVIHAAVISSVIAQVGQMLTITDKK